VLPSLFAGRCKRSEAIVIFKGMLCWFFSLRFCVSIFIEENAASESKLDKLKFRGLPPQAFYHPAWRRTCYHDIVAKFIDSLNTMLRGLATPPDVWHVDLTGTLPNQNDWANELHPTNTGFSALADKIDAALQANI
jgi:hypothetical protein